MSEYTGSVELISGITPKNGGTFPLVNAKDVLMPDGKRLSEMSYSGGTLSADIVNDVLVVTLTGGLTASIQDGVLIVE